MLSTYLSPENFRKVTGLLGDLDGEAGGDAAVVDSGRYVDGQTPRIRTSANCLASVCKTYSTGSSTNSSRSSSSSDNSSSSGSSSSTG